MEEFTEEHSSVLLSNEWLVKVDNAKSTPYLFKFDMSKEKGTCLVLVTDMRNVWTEVLSRKQTVRRWNQCNPSISLENDDDSFFRLRTLIGESHTTGGVSDANFDLVESRDADLAFEFDYGKFRWRWDTYQLGPKTSSDVISKHLILPLISLTHVAFYSADPVSELEEGDLEKTVDKIGRTARRSVDIHVKQTLGRPRIASSLQRISSLLGLAPTLPSIRSNVEPTDLDGYLAALYERKPASDDTSFSHSALSQRDLHREEGAQRFSLPSSPHVRPNVELKTLHGRDDAESATESDDDDDVQNIPASQAVEPGSQSSASKASAPPAVERTSGPSDSHQQSHSQGSGSGSPPTKKIRSKPQNITDSDSDSDSQSRSKTFGNRSAAGRGVRQPIKRGGRRF